MITKILSNTTVRAFYNGLGQLRNIFTFEDIVQSRFHEMLFNCK